MIAVGDGEERRVGRDPASTSLFPEAKILRYEFAKGDTIEKVGKEERIGALQS